EDGQRYVRRDEDAMCQQVWGKGIHASGYKSGWHAKQIASPEECHDQADSGKCRHRRPAPEKQSIRVVTVQKVEAEIVFEHIPPFDSIHVQFGLQKQQRRGRNQFRERRVFRVHSKVTSLPVTESRSEMDCFICSGRESGESKTCLKAERN